MAFLTRFVGLCGEMKEISKIQFFLIFSGRHATDKEKEVAKLYS